MSQTSREARRKRGVDLRKSRCIWPVASLILCGVCISACDRESTPPAQKLPEASAAPPANSTAPASQQAQPPPTGTTSKAQRTPLASETKPQRSGGDHREPVTRTFAVYTLSRGRGVPPEAREAQQRVQKLVQADRERGVKASVETTRIGIEGEQRLCVTYENARDGVRAVERVRAIVTGVDLVNLVEEPCTLPQSKTPKQEES